MAVDPDEMKLQKPKDGKKVTEEEFKTIVAEKMKEMGIEEGGPEGGSPDEVLSLNSIRNISHENSINYCLYLQFAGQLTDRTLC